MSQRELDPYERIVTRVNGIKAIGVLADVALEDGSATPGVWHSLWYFLGQVVEEIEADALLLGKELDVAKAAAARA